MKALRRICSFRVRMSVYAILILFALLLIVSPENSTIGMAFTWGSGCADSDWGRGYYLKGTVSYQGQDFADECYWGEYVYEYYCWNGKVDVAWYRCPDGCRDGACLA